MPTRRFGSASIASAAAEYVEDQASPGSSCRAREAIELPDDQRVALMDRFHRFEQGESIDFGAGDMLSENLFRIRLRSATSGSARF
jgi:hypothetical protein